MSTVRVEDDGPVRTLVLDRPEKRNAMSLQMVGEIEVALASVADDQVRILIIRGSGGHFSAGGDVADMARAAAEPMGDFDPIAKMNRRFGSLLEAVDACPAAVVALCEGGVMGGGFGLACVADVTIAVRGARFRLPETSLGLLPAQIAPYLVQRLGLAQARRLAVTGETLDADEAQRLDVAHLVIDPDAIDATLAKLVRSIGRCEPAALAATKALVRRVGGVDLGDELDRAAEQFAALARSKRAQQGFSAFISRQEPPWAL